MNALQACCKGGAHFGCRQCSQPLGQCTSSGMRCDRASRAASSACSPSSAPCSAPSRGPPPPPMSGCSDLAPRAGEAASCAMLAAASASASWRGVWQPATRFSGHQYSSEGGRQVTHRAHDTCAPGNSCPPPSCRPPCSSRLPILVNLFLIGAQSVGCCSAWNSVKGVTKPAAAHKPDTIRLALAARSCQVFLATKGDRQG